MEFFSKLIAIASKRLLLLIIVVIKIIKKKDTLVSAMNVDTHNAWPHPLSGGLT